MKMDLVIVDLKTLHFIKLFQRESASGYIVVFALGCHLEVLRQLLRRMLPHSGVSVSHIIVKFVDLNQVYY
jgi:hypothetical protein